MGEFKNNFVSYKMTEPPEFIRLKIEESKYSMNNDYDISEIFEIPLEIDFEPNWEITEEKQNNNVKSKQNKEIMKLEYKGNDSFEKAFLEAVKIDPDVAKYKEFLVRTAKRETNFRNILNTAGAPYYGFFLMGKDLIKTTLGISVDEFVKNPVKQILGAVKLYKINMKTAKSTGTYDLCKSKGYSDDAIIAGAWAGGVGGVKKFITGKGDPSDSHWYGGSGGTSVGKVMNNWMKNV